MPSRNNTPVGPASPPGSAPTPIHRTMPSPLTEEEEPEQVPVENEVTSEDAPHHRRCPAPSQNSSVKLTRLQPLIEEESVIASEDQGTSLAGSEAQENVLITEMSDDEDDDVERESFQQDDEDEEVRHSGGVMLGLEGEDDFAGDGGDSDVDYGGVDIEQDNGYDTDLEIDDHAWLYPPEEYDDSGMKGYIKECNRLGIIPISYFQKHVHETAFIMRHHGLGPLGAKAIAKPLENNAVIEHLDLGNNEIGGRGAAHLCKILKENLYITELELSDNFLGSRGCRAMCTMMKENSHIAELDLSGNNFADKDCPEFHEMLLKNSNLRRLTLRHNHFEGEGLKCFRDALLQNENLKHLDLSWNHIRQKGATALAELVRDNYGLKSLNLQMNGLGDSGAAQFGTALKANQCLIELNIMSNRITHMGALELARGLLFNETLQIIRVGMNTLGEDGAMALMNAVDKNDSSAICLMDLSNVIVSKEFDELHEKVNKARHASKQLTVIHGGVYYSNKNNSSDRYDPEIAFQKDPMTKLKRYAESNKLRMVDLFKYFDRDNNWSVDRSEFIQGIKTTGIDISEEDIDLLIKRLDKDGDGEIDYGELVNGDLENRATKRDIMSWKEERAMLDERKREKARALILGDV